MKTLDIREDFLHKELKFGCGRSVELDIFFPNELLAFEYQGEHHFYDIYALGQPRWLHNDRDQEKFALCQQNSITLIQIPYWWDSESQSLLATVCQSRPDLLPVFDAVSPISTKPPETFHRGNNHEGMNYYLKEGSMFLSLRH